MLGGYVFGVRQLEIAVKAIIWQKRIFQFSVAAACILINVHFTLDFPCFL